KLCPRHDMAIIADEVFLDFALGEERPPSFAGNDGVLTFTMSGLSKISGLPQMKLAWLVADGPEGKRREALARLEVIADTYLSLSAPVQLEAQLLLAQRHGIQELILDRVHNKLEEIYQQLSNSI